MRGRKGALPRPLCLCGETPFLSHSFRNLPSTPHFQTREKQVDYLRRTLDTRHGVYNSSRRRLSGLFTTATVLEGTMANVTSSRRAKGLELLTQGVSPKDVAARLGVGLSSVYRWRGAHVSLDPASVEPPRQALPQAFDTLLTAARNGDEQAAAQVLKLARQAVGLSDTGAPRPGSPASFGGRATLRSGIFAYPGSPGSPTRGLE